MITKSSQNDPKIIPQSSQNNLKMIPKSFQNHPKIIPKSSQNHPKLSLGGTGIRSPDRPVQSRPPHHWATGASPAPWKRNARHPDVSQEANKPPPHAPHVFLEANPLTCFRRPMSHPHTPHTCFRRAISHPTTGLS